MTYDFRVAVDYSYGTLSAGATSLDGTLNSERFRDLPSDLSTEKYLPITLAEDTARRWEVVWVVGHGPNSSAIEVVRAREGTTAGTWPTGSSWRCAPTARDGTVTTGADVIYDRYPDPHIGMRAVLIDVPKVVQYTDTGWQDAAPHKGGRMHGWKQVGAPAAHGVLTKITGMGAYGPNAIATYGTSGAKNGTVTVNEPGVWSIIFMIQSIAYTAPTMMEARIEWPGNQQSNGAQTGRTNQNQTAYANAHHVALVLSWTGYVNEDQATSPISFFVKQYNPFGHVVGGLDYYVVMYYLGN